MTCNNSTDLPTIPHTYTEGDRLPSFLVVFPAPIDLTTGWTITAQVERPDGTYFERIAAILDAQNAQFNWLATDWVAGCSRVTVQAKDPAGLDETSDPFIVKSRELPGAV